MHACLHSHTLNLSLQGGVVNNPYDTMFAEQEGLLK
jgi:hypothetical protein